MSAYKFKEESARKMLNKNQEWLRDIDMLMRSRSSNPGEVARLADARKDVASRLTAEELAEYEATKAGNSLSEAERAKQWAADMADMELNRDSNSI